MDVLSPVDRSKRLEQLLLSPNNNLEEIRDILASEIDPEYKDGQIVTKAFLELGEESLGWFKYPNVAMKFVSSRTRAWKLLSAVIEQYEAHNNQGTGALEIILKYDQRPNRERSVAYLAMLRKAIQLDATELVEMLIKEIDFDIGLLVESLAIDFTTGEHLRKFDENYYEGSAYLAVLNYLRSRDNTVVDAFVVTQLMGAKDSDSVAINMIAAEGEYKGLMYVHNFKEHESEIKDVMERELRTTRTEDLPEKLHLLYTYTPLFTDSREITKALVDVVVSRGLPASIEDGNLKIGRKKAILDPAFTHIIHRDALHLADVYLSRKDNIRSKEDLQAVLEEIENTPEIEDEDAKYEIASVLEQRYRYPLWKD